MLSPDNYEKLVHAVNGKLKIKTHNYLKSHYLPNWYKNIQEYTIESYITNKEEAPNLFIELGWDKSFIKDYVKSLKTGKGSIVDSSEDVIRALDDMMQYKGYIEGGVVFRKLNSLQENTETRFFVLNGQVFGHGDIEMNILAQKIAEKHAEYFYSIDIARDQDNKLVVIEVGDGQVSEAVNWDLQEFVNIFKSLQLSNKMKWKPI